MLPKRISGEPSVWYQRFIVYYLDQNEKSTPTVSQAYMSYMADQRRETVNMDEAAMETLEQWQQAANKYNWLQRRLSASQKRAEPMQMQSAALVQSRANAAYMKLSEGLEKAADRIIEALDLEEFGRDRKNSLDNAHKVLGMFGIGQATRVTLEVSPMSSFMIPVEEEVSDHDKKRMLREVMGNPEAIAQLRRLGVIKGGNVAPTRIDQIELSENDQHLQEELEEITEEYNSRLSKYPRKIQIQMIEKREKKARAVRWMLLDGREHHVPEDWDRTDEEFEAMSRGDYDKVSRIIKARKQDAAQK